MIIRKADFNDLECIRLIYQSARKFMSEIGNPNQWGNVNPPLERTKEDVRENNLYVVEDDDDILAVYFITNGAKEHLQAKLIAEEKSKFFESVEKLMQNGVSRIQIDCWVQEIIDAKKNS